MTMFSFNTSLTKRILMGFIFLASVGLLIIVINVLSLNIIKGLFDDYSNSSKDTYLVSEVEADVIELNRLILAYRLTGSQSLIDEVESLLDGIDTKIKRLMSDHEHLYSDNESIKNMGYSLQQLSEKVAKLATASNSLKALQNSLSHSFSEYHNTISLVLGSLSDNSNPAVSYKLNESRSKVSRAEVIINKYFTLRANENKTRFIELMVSAKNTVSELLISADTENEHESFRALMGELNQIETAFYRTLQADRNFIFLVNVIIAGEADELSNLSAELKQNSIELQSNLLRRTEQNLSHYQNITFLGSISLLVVAVFISGRISRSVTQPIRELAQTFDDITDYRDVKSIPGILRKDEIGRLSRSAELFKINWDQTRTLLAESKQLANELKQRETELKEIAQEAHALANAKSVFLANMSHEIRTPMNGIIGMIGLLEDTPLSAQQQKFTAQVKRSAESLLRIINDILDYSKIESGKLGIETTEFELEQVIADVGKIVEPGAAQKGLTLLCPDSTFDNYRLTSDPGRIKQVLLNLLSNAIKFTDTGQVRLNVQMAHQNDGSLDVHFSVQDTGIGIKEEEQNKLFTRFNQLDSATTRRQGGTGLGLAISAQLVHLMGGELKVKSKFAVGSEFYFTLNIVDYQALPRDTFIGAVPNFLCMTNDASIASVIADFLRQGEFQVTQIADLDAVGVLTNTLPDSQRTIVILDSNALDTNSVSRIQALGSKNVSFVLLTSLGENIDKLLVELVSESILLKPLSPTTLFNELRLLLSTAQAESTNSTEEPEPVLSSLNCKALLVEDDAINQQVAGGILSKFSVSFDIAEDGLRALELLEKNEYDLVLMDCMMPNLDGYEATRKLRAGEAGSVNHHIPVIALTADAMMGVREKCLQAGMSDYLTKPIMPELLISKMQFWLDKTRTHR
jgi:signal transduction histidine kinase/CheY-like chemotaxis protein